MKIREILLTIYFYLVLIPIFLITYFICILIYPFADEKTFTKIYMTFISKNILFFMTTPGFWSIKITDLRTDKSWKNIDGTDKQFILIANHISYIDSLIISVIPLKFKFMIAQIFTKIPVFGWITRCSGFVTADRNNPVLNKTAVDKAIETINRDKCSFCLFPQGRRNLIPYKDDKIHTGAFRISKASNIPILPLSLKGVFEAMQLHGTVGFSNIELIIHEPFYVTDDNYDKWIEKTKNII